MDRKTIGIIQARLGSTRLPGKILRKVRGKALLQHMVERLLNTKRLDEIVIATTTNQTDDELEHFARNNGYAYFRGSEHDVLDRFYQTALEFKADIVVRFCSDCPIIDPYYVDLIIEVFFLNEDKISMVCNKMPFTFPDGFDTEVCSFQTLEKIWKNARTYYEREHVFPYLYLHPEMFPVMNIEYEGNELFHSHRFTLDYEEDFDCIKVIIEHLYDANPYFGLEEILKLSADKPEILKINRMHLPDPSVKLAIDSGHSPSDNTKAKKETI